jgi:UDP-glucuronate 4-epimerase
MSKEKVLITGIGGFIGFHVAKKLIVNGYDIIGIDNLNNYYSPNLKKSRLRQLGLNTDKLIENEIIKGQNLTFLYADISDAHTWSQISDYDISGVIHLAAQAGVRYSLEAPMAYINSNILGFQYVIDYCVKNSITAFLYASSSSVYGKDTNEPFYENAVCNAPESLYAATKRCNELISSTYFKTKGLTSIGLRFFTVYGPWGRPDMLPMIMAYAALNNTILKIFNQGNQYRDFTYIDDIVEGVIRCLSLVMEQKITGSHILNIGKGAPQHLMDFISEFEKQFDMTIQKSFLEAQPGDVSSTYANIDELKKLTEYEPIVDYKEGLKYFISWIKEFKAEVCVE